MNSLVKFGKIKMSLRSLRTFKFSDKISKNELKGVLKNGDDIFKDIGDETINKLRKDTYKEILKYFEDSFNSFNNITNLDLDKTVKHHYLNKRLPNNVDKLFSISENNSTNIISSSLKDNEIMTSVEILNNEISKNPNLLDSLIVKFVDRNADIKKKIDKLDKPDEEKLYMELKNHVKDQIKQLLHTNNSSRNSSFFKSLLNIYKSGYDIRNSEQIKRDNFLQFEEYKTFSKPKDQLTSEELLNIHMQIDIKMKELEDMGKSKEQILYNENKGIPLKQDPFFQFLKINRKAREMMFQPKEIFSVESLINKALKQNIGPDPYIGVNQKRIKDNDNLDDDYQITEENKKFNSKYRDESLKDEDYYYKTNNKFKNYLLENYLCKNILIKLKNQ